MPIFRFGAYGPHGELAEGSIEAPSADAASDLLWAQGLTSFRLRALGQPQEKWWQRELWSGRGSRRADLATFTRELATLRSADIPVDDALRILSDQGNSTSIGRLAAELRADVLNGLPLSDAMQKSAQVFPTDYVSMVRAGEVGGASSEIFAELADLLERRIEIRARIRSALVYPALLLTVAVISLAIIIGGLVPTVAAIFAANGKPLPASIGFMMAVQSRWQEILIGLSVTGLLGTLAISASVHRPGLRRQIDRFLLKAPVVGGFVLQQDTARFARTLGTLIKAGVPLLQASGAARLVMRNGHVAAEIDRAIEDIRDGAPLNRALQARTTLPRVALRMIATGEEAAKLDRMLLRVATTFEQQTQRSIEKFMTILTPLLTVTMAALVGSLIVAVMDAVMSMNDLAFR